MSFVMLREIEFAVISKAFANQVRNVQFLFQPERHGHQERCPTSRDKRQVSLQQPLKFQYGFVVKYYVIQVFGRNSGLLQAPLHGLMWKTMIVLHTREALLLHCRNNNSILDQASGAVMIKGRYSKYIHLLLPPRRLKRLTSPKSFQYILNNLF